MTNKFDDENNIDAEKENQVEDVDSSAVDMYDSEYEESSTDGLYDDVLSKYSASRDDSYDGYSEVVDDIYESRSSSDDSIIGDNSTYLKMNDSPKEDESKEDEVDNGGEFDYMSYMSVSSNSYNNDDTKGIETDEPKEEVAQKEEKNGNKIVITIVVSAVISALISAGMCLGIVLGMPQIDKILGVNNQKEAFTTHKTVTIENKSNELVAEIAEKVSPSIVCIKETILTRDFLFGVTEAKGHGSGIIFREDGYILTNNHVIESALENNTNNVAKGCKIEVILPSSKENETYEAKVIGRDSKTDLAVIKIEKTGLSAATFGDSDKLRVGETAVAIGNPYSLEFMGTVTSGVISGLNRTIQSEDGRQFKLIQTDAAINSGNSGGALVNSRGEVIGINTLKLVDSGIEGLSFAVPSNTAKEIADNLVEYKYVKGRPLLGIIIDPRYTEALAKRYGMPAGVYVYSVDLLSAAYKAGIEAGDVITEFAGVKIADINQLNAEKEKYKAGDEVTIKVYKTSNGKTKTVTLKLGEDVGTSS